MKTNTTKPQVGQFIRVARTRGGQGGAERLPKGRIGRVLWVHPVNDETQVAMCEDPTNPQLGRFLRLRDFVIVPIADAEGTVFRTASPDHNGHVKDGVFHLDK